MLWNICLKDWYFSKRKKSMDLGMGHPSNRWALNLFSTKTDGPWDRNMSTHQYRWILGWGKFSNLWAHKATLKVSRRTAKDRAFGKLLRPKTTIDFHVGPQDKNQWTYPGRHHWKPWFLRLWFYFVLAGQEQNRLHSSRTKVFNGGA